jgi:hypothetical protein
VDQDTEFMRLHSNAFLPATFRIQISFLSDSGLKTLSGSLVSWQPLLEGLVLEMSPA